MVKFYKKTIDRKQDRRISLLERRNKAEVKTADDFGYLMVAGNTIAALAPIGEGTGPDERIGNDINLKYIRFKYCIRQNASTSSNPGALRVVILRDNDSDAAVPAITNVFPNYVAATGAGYMSFVDRVTQKGRFSILYDKMHATAISATGVPAANLGQGDFKKSYKVGAKIQYSGAASTNYGNGQLYVALLGNSAVNNLLDWEVRILYTDS